MSFDAATTAIEARATSLWPTLEPTVGVAFENTNFRRPKTPDGGPGEWILVRIEWTGGEDMSIGSPGSNLARRQGHIWIDAFIPSGTIGVSRAHQLAAKAAGMFEGRDFSGVVCEAAMPGGPNGSEDGNYGESVAIPFDYDESA